jgi:nucleoside-diphosphate-sugar epimerase
MRPTKSTIGITGGRGTLGKIAATQLTRNGYDIDLFTGDIRNTSDLDQWIKGSAMDALLHFAAIVPTQKVADQPDLAFAVNAEGTKKLLQTLCQHKKNIWFFYASSSHVYASKSIPIKETDATEPMNMYGKTKLAGEQFLINGAQDFLGEKNETFKRNERCLDRIRYFAVDYDRSFNFYTTIFLVHLLKI